MPCSHIRLAHPRTLVLALTLGLSTWAAQAATPPTPAVPADDPLVWDLRPLFATDTAWDAERQALLAELPRLAALKGTLAQGPAALRRALDATSAADRRLERLWVYASTQQSTDNRLPRNQERMSLVHSLWGARGEATAWLAPEVQALGSERVEAALRSEPGLAPHAVGLRDMLRLARHTLSPETEAALAALAPVTGAAGQTRTLLVDADMRWPSLTVDGQPVEVSETGYEKLRQHPDRAVRQQAMSTFFKRLGEYENTFGSTLSTSIQAGVVQAKLRRYPSAIAASLAENDIPEAVLRTLVAQANAGLPTLHRYFKLRQRMLGLPDLAYHDIYPNLVKAPQRYPIDEAKRLTLAATEPLGPEYQALLRHALGARTMHVRPAPGKSGGAYQTAAYGELPLVFLNHQDDYESVSTFAHEWGHGMHTALANASQPYETSDYALFVAEVASITNEVLLSEYMLAQARNTDERLFQLGYALEQMRATFFRQTQFAEFELATHDALERGEALTGRRMTELYCQLVRNYHGADQGVMSVAPEICHEWAFISHFYRPFYVYQYATSITAATELATRILAGQPGARDTYLDILRAGGSQPPYQLLKQAGVDLASPAPYQTLLARMNRVMDEMERLLANRPKG